MKVFKVFLLDDHKIIRDGIRSILLTNPSFRVTGEEGNPVNFLENLDKLDIDILVLDLSLPNVSGFQLIPKIKKQAPAIKILVLSMHNDPETMQRCMSLGANGYIPKDSDSEQMLKALEAVAEGKVYFENVASTATVKNVKDNLLSQREREVLTHLSNGLSSKQIGNELNISTRTVETHRLNIMKKLNTTNSAETISVAARLHLI